MSGRKLFSFAVFSFVVFGVVGCEGKPKPRGEVFKLTKERIPPEVAMALFPYSVFPSQSITDIGSKQVVYSYYSFEDNTDKENVTDGAKATVKSFLLFEKNDTTLGAKIDTNMDGKYDDELEFLINITDEIGLLDFPDDSKFPDMYIKVNKRDRNIVQLATAEWYRGFIELDDELRPIILLDYNNDKKCSFFEHLYIGEPQATREPPIITTSRGFTEAGYIFEFNKKLYRPISNLEQPAIEFRPIRNTANISIKHTIDMDVEKLECVVTTYYLNARYEGSTPLSDNCVIPAGKYSTIRYNIRTADSNECVLSFKESNVEIKSGETHTVDITSLKLKIQFEQKEQTLRFGLSLGIAGGIREVFCNDFKNRAKTNTSRIKYLTPLKASITLAKFEEPDKILGRGLVTMHSSKSEPYPLDVPKELKSGDKVIVNVTLDTGELLGVLKTQKEFTLK